MSYSSTMTSTQMAWSSCVRIPKDSFFPPDLGSQVDPASTRSQEMSWEIKVAGVICPHYPSSAFFLNMSLVPITQYLKFIIKAPLCFIFVFNHHHVVFAH